MFGSRQAYLFSLVSGLPHSFTLCRGPPFPSSVSFVFLILLHLIISCRLIAFTTFIFSHSSSPLFLPLHLFSSPSAPLHLYSLLVLFSPSSSSFLLPRPLFSFPCYLFLIIASPSLSVLLLHLFSFFYFPSSLFVLLPHYLLSLFIISSPPS